MSLENKVNRTLNNIRSFKSRLVSNARKAAYVGLISLALAGTKIASIKADNPNIINPNTDYSLVNPNNLQNELTAAPELGYVIKTGNESDINLLNNMLSSSGNIDIKQIGGIGHKSLSIVYDNNPNKIENRKTTQALKNYAQVKYAAPLFSVNGETVAVIPEIVAKVRDEADYSRLEDLCNSLNLSIKKKMDFTNTEYLIEVLGNDANDVFESVNNLNNTKFIEWASPNLAFQPKLCGASESGQFIPNDELFSMQWYLQNINALESWEITTGDPNITIAVLDTGVDYNHPDLFENIWVNKNIVPDTNSDGKIDIHDLDLDGSGSIEDSEITHYGSDKFVVGWDYVNNDNFPHPSYDPSSDPNHAHGTVVAGIIAAKGNNGIGVIGVASNCKIMPIIMHNTEDFIVDSDIATAIRSAAENGADILNLSWGYTFYKSIIHSAIKDINSIGGIGRRGLGCLIFGAAGNGGERPNFVLYPGRHPEAISVGATDPNNKIWSYCNRGIDSEIVAPGGGKRSYFWTTDTAGSPGANNYGYPNVSLDYTNIIGGTSTSCPVASGVGALVLSANPNLTGIEARRILSRSSTDLGSPGWDKDYGTGFVDAEAAVIMASNPPSPILFVSKNSNQLENGSQEFPYKNIQGSINVAVPGDIVMLLPGIYTGLLNRDIDFRGKPITVQSREGPQTCIVDGQGLGRIFYFHNKEGPNSIIKGLTIMNGRDDYGAGIIISSTSTPTISNCIFTNNYADKSGGGLYTYKDLKLINCTFSKNYAGESGGGAYIFYSSSPIITNCIFWGNVPDEIYLGRIIPEYPPNPPGPEIIATPDVTYSAVREGVIGLGNINRDPLFTDPNNGDYHLKSQAGRWNPRTQSWVKDDVTSPCIDAGNPGSSLEDELLSIPDKPNEEVYNSRINMGVYGGTSEASFSPYNWTLPADLTNDGTVNFKDFAIFANYFKKTGNNQPADLNLDRRVDIADLTWLTGDWLKEAVQYNKQ